MSADEARGTGIESARHNHYDPQGAFAVGSNVANDFAEHEYKHIGGDLFDGVVIAAADGYGANRVVGTASKRTTVCLSTR